MSGRARALGQLLVLAAVVGVLAFQLWPIRADLVGTMSRTPAWLLPVGVAVTAAGGMLGMLSWRTVAAGVGVDLPVRSAAWMFFAGALARYIPGGVWPAMVHVAVGRRVGRPPGGVAAAFPISVAVSCCAGVVAGLVAVPSLWGPIPVGGPALVGMTAAACAGGVLSLRPVLLAARRLVGRRRPAVRSWLVPTASRLLRATVLATAGWVVTGLHVGLLTAALGGSVTVAASAVSAFCLAAVAGMVVFLLPAGLGARDGLLLILLARYLPAAEVAAVVLLSRLVITLADIVSAAVAFGCWTARGRREDGLATGSRPTPCPAVEGQSEYAAASRRTASSTAVSARLP